MSPILMKFGPEVSFRVRTPKQVSIFSYQSLVVMETGKLILAIFVQFGHEKNHKYLLILQENMFYCIKEIIRTMSVLL